MISYIILIIIGFALMWSGWKQKNKKFMEMANQFPGPQALPFIGNALRFMCQPEELISVIKELLQVYGEASRFWLGPNLNVVINNPDDLKILLSSSKTSIKGPQYKYMADILGGGILSGSGVTWRKHRKIATPNYGKKVVDSYEKIFNEEVHLLLKKLRNIPSEQEFDIYNKIVQTTSYCVCQTLLNLSKEQVTEIPHLQEIIDCTPRNYDIVFDRMIKWYLQIDPVFWMTKSYQDQKHFVALITEFSKAIIENRKREINKIYPNNEESINRQLGVIDRFILSEELTQEELIKETFTIFTSSQEATAKICSFVLLMMAYHPKSQEKLYEEITKIIGDKDRCVTNEDFKQMPYLDMVFKEVLRLFPIGSMLQRTINENIRISSGTIPAGCSLVAPIYHLHRDSRFWTRPDDFDPERFNPVNTKLRQPNCYIPFSLGPMDCLGRYFGTRLVKMICVRVLREFEVTTSRTYKDLKLSIAISVSPLDGFPVKLHPRKIKEKQ